MPEQAAFSACHPAVIFLYFTLVLLFSMFLMHPVCLLISLFCAVCCLSVLTRGHGLWRSVAWVLPVVAVTALINPLFNHAGITVLCYLPHGNALTGESLVYGLAAGIMLAAVLVCGAGALSFKKGLKAYEKYGSQRYKSMGHRS